MRKAGKMIGRMFFQKGRHYGGGQGWEGGIWPPHLEKIGSFVQEVNDER